VVGRPFGIGRRGSVELVPPRVRHHPVRRVRLLPTVVDARLPNGERPVILHRAAIAVESGCREPECSETVRVDEPRIRPPLGCPPRPLDVELALSDDSQTRASSHRDGVDRRSRGAIERRVARELLHLERQDVRVPELHVVELVSALPHLGGGDPGRGHKTVHFHAIQPEGLSGAVDRVLEEGRLFGDGVGIHHVVLDQRWRPRLGDDRDDPQRGYREDRRPPRCKDAPAGRQERGRREADGRGYRDVGEHPQAKQLDVYVDVMRPGERLALPSLCLPQLRREGRQVQAPSEQQQGKAPEQREMYARGVSGPERPPAECARDGVDDYRRQ
jgi:hypothetical protein